MNWFKTKRLAAFLLSAVLLLSITGGVSALAEGERVNTVTYTGSVENERYTLSCDQKSGDIKLVDKLTGQSYFGVPEQAEEDPIAKGTFKMVLRSQLVLRAINILTNQLADVTSFAGSVNKNTVSVEQLSDGFRVTYTFQKEEITVPVYFRLSGDRFVVKVVSSEIKEGTKYWIRSMEILPSFAAGSVTDEGFIMVPDGSGALIRFNNGKSHLGEYSGTVYGRDDTFYLKKKTTVTEEVRFPVFGMEKNGYGFVAVASGADAAGKLYASTSGTRNSYNRAFFGFTLHSSDTIYINKDTWYEKGIMRVNEEQEFDYLQVDYRFYTEQNGGYFRMAELYREELPAASNQKEKAAPSLSVSILSAIDVDKSFLGIPMNLISTLSTFEETGKILDQLGGTDTMSVRLLNSSYQEVKKGKKSGYSGMLMLGGNGGLKNLLQKEGTQYFAEVNLPFFNAGIANISAMLSGVKSLSNETALKYTYDIADFSISKKFPSMGLMRHHDWLSRAENIGKDTKNLGFDGVSLGQMSEAVYSDYSAQHKVYRQQAKEKICEVYEKGLKDSDILAASPNAFVIPYADLLTDIPSCSSAHDLFDGDVPFFALVLNGYKTFSYRSVNLEADRQIAKMQILEMGAVPHYTLFYRKADAVKDTRYSSYYSCYYGDWKDEIQAIRQEAAEFSAKNGTITAHRQLDKDLFEVTYQSGAKYLFNYGLKDATVGDVTVKAASYVLVKGE